MNKENTKKKTEQLSSINPDLSLLGKFLFFESKLNKNIVMKINLTNTLSNFFLKNIINKKKKNKDQI